MPCRTTTLSSNFRMPPSTALTARRSVPSARCISMTARTSRPSSR
ncbi:hypothetical protein ACFFX0_09895 [Citricoccus parietis]|uniref:Uncharacterized protein n=1 Tax=Citricoccus parietis TaxID=592307 RepID=A0ABV5FXT3_9MICC